MNHAKTTVAKWVMMLTLFAGIIISSGATRNAQTTFTQVSDDNNKSQLICVGHTGTCP